MYIMYKCYGLLLNILYYSIKEQYKFAGDVFPLARFSFFFCTEKNVASKEILIPSTFEYSNTQKIINTYFSIFQHL